MRELLNADLTKQPWLLLLILVPAGLALFGLMYVSALADYRAGRWDTWKKGKLDSCLASDDGCLTTGLIGLICTMGWYVKTNLGYLLALLLGFLTAILLALGVDRLFKLSGNLIAWMIERRSREEHPPAGKQ